MAATFDGFSIRDYTSKMRSIDVFKCWPFASTSSRDTSREEVQSWLPPMNPCPRSDDFNDSHAQNLENPPSAAEVSRTDGDGDCSEEESAESMDFEKSAPPSDSNNNEDEKLEMVCPVCREFNAVTLTAVNAHIDGCLAQTMREERRHMRIMNLKSSSSKSKPLKKRSIAEIFKVEEQQQPPRPQLQPPPLPQIESVLKFWPFRKGEANDVSITSITVTKFEWLSRRLEALRSRPTPRGGEVKSDQGESSEEKMEMVCPVCRDFNAATVTAVNAHIDGCLAQAVREERRQMRRTTVNCKPIPKAPPKPKVPKKRSIAEILTVAPPFEASKRKAIQVEEEDEEKSDYGYSGGDSTSSATPAPYATVASPVASVIKNNKSTMKNRNKKKLKKKSKVEKHGDSGVWFVNHEKKTVVSKKKRKKKKNAFNNVPTGNKDDAYERMVQNAVNSSRKLKGTIDNKMLPLHEVDPSIDRKKQVKNCDSVGKQPKAVSPVHGILKNHFKHVSEKTSSGSSIGDGTEESHDNDQEPTSNRHVKFSGKDDILGPKKTNSFDETMFKLSSDALASSIVKEKSSGSDEETASLEPNRNYDHIAVNIDRDKREEVCPIVESKQFSNTLEQDTVQSFLKPCINQEKSKQLEEKSELLTKVAVCDNIDSQFFYGGNRTTLHCSPYADISRPLSAVQEEQMSGINTQVCESGSFSYSGKLDHLDDPQVDAVNSNENTETFLEPSSSYSASYNANEKPESPLQTYGDKDNSGEALGDRQFSRMLSADMIDNSFPITGWEKGSDKNSCLDPNFFGLPLNSHGELINFSSSGDLRINQSDTSSTLRGSFSGLPINNILHQNNQENLSINENHVVQKTFPKDCLNPFPHHPTRLPVTELQSREREDIHRPNSSDMCSGHYVPPLNSELNRKKNSFIEQNPYNRVRNHNGNGVVSLKEDSDHISPSSNQPTMRLMGKDVPIGRSSQEMQQFAGDVWPDEESRRRNYSEYAALDHSLLGRSSKQNWASGSPLQISADNVLQSAKIQSNQAAQSTILMSSTYSGFSQQFIDRLEQFIPGAKPLGLISQSVVLPTPGNFSHSPHVTNGELNDKNTNPHVTKSAFGFPFLQPTVNEQAKTSWFHSPYRSSPSWLSSSTDEMLPGTFSRQFSASISQNFPQNLWGNNFTTPFVNHSAEVRFPSNHLTSLGPMQTTPLSPSSIVHPLHFPVTPSTINSGNRNINKVADRLKFDEHHLCANTRKNPAAAANLDDSRLPNIQVQENLSRMTRLPEEKSSVELQRNTRALELDPHMGSARSRCCQHEAQNQNPGSYPAVNSFKLDSMVTSGPVRLGPKRAKHILNSS
uniref:UBZ4-type domain-containing protein n=2 Tax=Glycine max TaxID=3847 RepID=A0A0R0L2U0_SOYBN